MKPPRAILSITLEPELTDDPIVSLRLATARDSFLIMAELHPATTRRHLVVYKLHVHSLKADRTHSDGLRFARSSC